MEEHAQYVNPEAVESKEYPGFYHVPGFDRYVINVHGTLIDTKLKREKTWYTQRPTTHLSGRYRNIRRGYRIARLIHEDGHKKHIFQHRVLGILFVECDGDVNALIVNHKDGDGGNNAISNLEWSTYSENMIHAYSAGLCSTRKVIARKVATGEEIVYRSAAECARAFNLSHCGMRNRLTNNPGKVYNGISFKYSDDRTAWSSEEGKCTIKEDLLAYNVLNKTLFTAKTIERLSELTGISSNIIGTSLSTNCQYPINGFIFDESSSGFTPPDVSDEKLELFKLTNRRSHQDGWLVFDMDDGSERVMTAMDVNEILPNETSHTYRQLRKGVSNCGRYRFKRVSPLLY